MSKPTKPAPWETNAPGPCLTIDSPDGPVAIHSLGDDRFLLTGLGHKPEVTGFGSARDAAHELAGER
jgi:hypothetical protein